MPCFHLFAHKSPHRARDSKLRAAKCRGTVPRLFRKKKFGIPCPGSKVLLEKHAIRCQILCGPRTPSAHATIMSKGDIYLPNSSVTAIAGPVFYFRDGERRDCAERWTGTSGVSCHVAGQARAQSCTRPASFFSHVSFGSAKEHAHRAVRPEAKFPQGVVVLFLFDCRSTALQFVG